MFAIARLAGCGVDSQTDLVFASHERRSSKPVSAPVHRARHAFEVVIVGERVARLAARAADAPFRRRHFEAMESGQKLGRDRPRGRN